MAVNQPLQRPVRDRRIYTWVAVLFPLIVLLGFARTYYLRNFFDAPPIPSLLVHIHGVVMSAWVLLFVAQVWLVASKRVRIHQKLGIAGAVLAVLVFVVGVSTAVLGAARGPTAIEPAPLQFLVVPLGDMFVFAVLIGIALYFRRRPEIHKRLMLVGALSLLPAAVARIPLNFITAGGPLFFFGIPDLLIIVFAAFDTIKHRRLHPAFLWGGLFAIVSHPLRLLLAGTDLWARFAAALVGLVS